MTRRRSVLVTVLLATIATVTTVALGFGISPALADPAPPPGTPTAVHFAGIPSVGAIFDDGLSEDHSCSASVVRSPGHDLVLTAAHCVDGTGAGMLFVPGYLNGSTPYGVWTVRKVWVAPTWLRSQDPRDDYAFLEVAAQTVGHRRVNVEDRTGGSVLGVAPRNGSTVTDVAYPDGINDEPITCTNRIVETSGYPTFNCNGYPGGTSGSPFLVTHRGQPNVVVGLIGGLHQGGCYDWNSFSSPFGPRTYATYLRAVLHLPADTVPAAGGDGC
ncbi:MAG TPA: trypsin-like peptidase domain-containing protein [Mycobacteriales bacterium]|nr:trypsin-like peptidase domain-containing protein [Mycobacteriales bacterium]